MKTFLSRAAAVLFVCVTLLPAAAQDRGREMVSEETVKEDSSSWYGDSAQAPTPRMIIQQKAQMRAYQRMARMESMKWYGMSAARPLASTTPFMGVPSPRYEMPGGRPFAWYPARTEVIIMR